MIVEYHRPEKVETAIKLLKRKGVRTLPLGGGTVLNQPSPDAIAVVDLQSLGFNLVERKGNSYSIGSTVTLQQLLNVDGIYPAINRAIHHETSYNIRQVATIAGSLVSSDGRSPISTVMLALGVKLDLIPGEEQISLGDLLPMRTEILKGKLITQISIPADLTLFYDYVARTPADLPIVCIGIAQWASGRTRIAVGGYGSSPILAFDGPNHNGADLAAKDVYCEASDEWASGKYRGEIASILTKRFLHGNQPG